MENVQRFCKEENIRKMSQTLLENVRNMNETCFFFFYKEENTWKMSNTFTENVRNMYETVFSFLKSNILIKH